MTIADQVVDARRLLCPMPILRAEAAMQNLPDGATLAVRATDPGISRDLPAWCRVNGHRLLEIRQSGREWTGFVVKGGQEEPSLDISNV
ncbi:MAG: sulfurtransferase TusA family protein [Magnetococcales bacterium]|nr:sulfurtransferase TusA family protein [Magnetococcales bacterium]